MTAEPPAMSDSDGYDQATKINAHRNCPEYVSHESDEYNGVFTYRSKGADGRQCAIVIGMRTRKVVKLVP
jgi:hypothetical protein